MEGPDSTHLRTLKREDPGETTHTIPFHLFIDLKADYDRCFAYDDWCYAYASAYASAHPYGTEAFASAWVYAMTYCAAGAAADAFSVAGLLAAGNFEVTRKGNAGAVKEIDLRMVLEQATLTWARAGAGAVASGVADLSSFATASLEELCNFWYSYYDYYGYWYVYYCTHETVDAYAYGSAGASACGTGLGSAQAASGLAVGGKVNVQGKNLQKFTTTVDGYAGSFAVADAQALANAYASVFAEAYAQSYEEACIKEVEQHCAFWCSYYNPWWPDCVDYLCTYEWCYLTSWDYDSDYADAFSSAYAAAVADAVAGAEVRFAALAYFERTRGLTSDKDEFGGDTIKFLGAGGSNVYTYAQCAA